MDLAGAASAPASLLSGPAADESAQPLHLAPRVASCSLVRDEVTCATSALSVTSLHRRRCAAASAVSAAPSTAASARPTPSGGFPCREARTPWQRRGPWRGLDGGGRMAWRTSRRRPPWPPWRAARRRLNEGAWGCRRRVLGSVGEEAFTASQGEGRTCA